VKPINPANPAVDEVVADWTKTKGAVGVRLMLREEQISDPTDPRLNRAFAAAGRHGLPVNFLCWGRLDQPPPLAQPWADLPKLLALASYLNVRVKISGACTLSREPFPYDDIWDPVLRIIDAFGIDRCMWGTDWTRTSGMLTYEQGVAPFRNTDRLSDSDRSDSDRSKLMGETLMQVYGW